jgi:hypothetical protein
MYPRCVCVCVSKVCVCVSKVCVCVYPYPRCVCVCVCVSKVWGDAAYKQEALELGGLVWQLGLLRKGPGLCHGIAGMRERARVREREGERERARER